MNGEISILLDFLVFDRFQATRPECLTIYVRGYFIDLVVNFSCEGSCTSTDLDTTGTSITNDGIPKSVDIVGVFASKSRFQ